MSRDPTLWLRDIEEACRRVLEYTDGMDRADLVADGRTWDAVVRNIEVIGEAARQLPDAVRAAAPDVPWAEIIGMRNILIHTYFSIDADILWDVVSVEVPELARRVHSLLETGDARPGE